MKVTSEELLDLFGLKVGDRIKLSRINGEFEPKFEILELELKEGLTLVGKSNIRSYKVEYHLFLLLDENFEIIKPKPKLTDDEKEIVKAFSKNAIKVEFMFGMLFFKNEIVEQIGALSLSEDSKKQFENLKTYDIKELLDE